MEESMLTKWASFILMMFVGSAMAGDALDLVKQHKEYGFQGVAMIVSAYETSDQPASEIQSVMRDSGLSKLQMPLSIDSTLAQQVVRHSPVERCGWQWGVYCHSEIQWTAKAPEKWKTLCMQGKTVLEHVQIPSVLLTQVHESHGQMQFDGVQKCWALGGDSLRLVLGPAPSQNEIEGIKKKRTQ